MSEAKWLPKKPDVGFVDSGPIIDKLTKENTRRFQVIGELVIERDKLKEELMEAYYEVAQHCTMRDGTVNSMAISGNANAIRFLAKHNQIKIIREYDEQIIGEWIKEKE